MGVTENVERELSLAKLFVLTSDYEGMPNALMEALAAGVPSISTDCPCGGPRELIKNGMNGLLVPCNDKYSLADSIDYLLSNENVRAKMSANAKESAKLFYPNTVNDKWRMYFEHVLKIEK